jgi:hypothetical protein
MSNTSGLSNIKVKPVKVVWDGTDLGFTEGGIEFSPEDQTVEIMTDQTGTQIVDHIRTGTGAEFSVTLKETSKERVEDAILRGREKAAAVAEVTKVTAVADSGGSLSAKYFTLNSANDATSYYVWIDVDAGSVDPAPAGGLTGIEVDISSGDSADDVATAIASAVGGNADFGASASGADVTITNAATGPATDAADVDAGFTVCTTVDGHGVVAKIGSDDQFVNFTTYAGPLYLHPISLVDSDATEDFYFPVAYPSLDSITMVGDNPSTIALTFRCYPKFNEDGTWCLWKYGERG